FRFAGEDRHTQVAAGVEADGVAVQHRQASRYMEAAHHDLDAGIAKRLRDIERAGILVGLHTDQPDQPEPAVALEALDHARNIDPRVGLIDDFDFDLDALSKHLAFGAIAGDAVHRRHRIGGDD